MTNLILLAAMALAPLTVKTVPSVCADPCQVRINIRVQPHEANRYLVVELNGEPMFRGSILPLRGEASPATQPEITFSGVPTGDYQIRVILYRGKKEFTRTTTALQVN